ncbi:MAG: xanthine dehydrogenase family protein molybdopterin-binding subunit [Alphaproteobacteria bacterium]
MSKIEPNKFGVGQSVRRVEDQRLLTGNGKFSDDLSKEHQLHAVFVRSPHAHALIKSVDITEAIQSNGVVRVYTGADLLAANVQPIGIRTELTNIDGTPLFVVPRQVLEPNVVRHVGDCVAAVIAHTPEQAMFAAEQINVEYEILEAVCSPKKALDANAPPLHQSRPDNLCFDWQAGDKQKARTALGNAHHRFSFDIKNNRVVPNPMEPRSVIVWPETDGTFTLCGSIQSVFTFQDLISRALNWDKNKLRCYCEDMGGGFGAKNQVQPEHILVTYAAADLNAPVKWTANRSEAFLSDIHARAILSNVSIGINDDLEITGVIVDSIADIGAYCSTNGPLIPTIATAVVFGGAYDIQSLYMHVRGAYTNTVPTDAYRGAGRPEVTFMLERAIELTAAKLNVNSNDIRRRNLIPTAKIPYKNAMGMNIDAGNFAGLFERMLAAENQGEIEQRKTKSLEQGHYRGVGYAFYMEATLGPPSEYAKLVLTKDGHLELNVGSQNAGMGHETALKQLIHQQTGVGLERISYRHADTDATPIGGGHGGSRTMVVAGTAVWQTTKLLVDKIKDVAADELEVSPSDLEFSEGSVCVMGTDMKLTLEQVAKAVSQSSADILSADFTYNRENNTFPYGFHICEVEVDPDTGQIQIERYQVLDDFGTIINPMITKGQIMGGVAQGLGQALMENVEYDTEGQLLSASFMDYSMPRSGDIPNMDISFFEDVPSPSNPLGVKGCGEAGAIGATPAVTNAVMDALKPLGIEHLDIPLTPHKVWKAIKESARHV